MTKFHDLKSAFAALTVLIGVLPGNPAYSAAPTPPPAAPVPSYADLADLVDEAPVILVAQIRSQSPIEPARSPGLAPGMVRLYVEARTRALIFGARAIGDSLQYLVDVPLDSRAKVPSLKKQVFLIFARPVAGRPGELQLVGRSSQLPWDPALEARVRGVIAERNAAGAPVRLEGVREAMFTAGTLAGESETQIFLATADGSPAALVIRRRPDLAPVWGVTFSEVLGSEGTVPPRDTLAWYRLACFLPATLPARANVSESPADKRAAERDYRLVMDQLGPCPRNLR